MVSGIAVRMVVTLISGKELFGILYSPASLIFIQNDGLVCSDIPNVYDQRKAILIVQCSGYQHDDIVPFYKEAEAASLEHCYEEAENVASKNNRKR